MEEKKMLPIGYDSFETIRHDDFYYVDKTGLIKELLENKTQLTSTTFLLRKRMPTTAMTTTTTTKWSS